MLISHCTLENGEFFKVNNMLTKSPHFIHISTGENGVRDAYTSFLASIPYEANKDERAKDFETHFQYTFYIINRLLSCYMTLIEKQNSKGRADIIIEGDTDIYIFEFKLDGSADEALKQIEDCQYALPYLNDSRKIHKIGVNISSETRTVAEWKVK